MKQAKNAADMDCVCCGSTDGSHGMQTCRLNADNRSMTDEEWCQYLKDLDKKYSTINRSSLHHDRRCQLHGHS